MSGRGRRRGRGGGGGGQQRNRGGQGGLRSNAGFWGSVALLPKASAVVRVTDEPDAVPRSLGAPPLPGHDTIAEHYFDAIYDRAVLLASALAAAGGLTTDDGDEPEGPTAV